MAKNKRTQADPPEKTTNDHITAFLEAAGVKNTQLSDLPTVNRLTGPAVLDPFEMVGPGGAAIPAEMDKWSRVNPGESAAMDAQELIDKGFQEVTDSRYHMRGLGGDLRGRIFVQPPELAEEAHRREYNRAHKRYLKGKQTTSSHERVQGGDESVTAKRSITSNTQGGQWSP